MQKLVTTLLILLIVCGLLLAPGGGASARGPGPSGEPFPAQRTSPAGPSPAVGDKVTNLLPDPSLEASYNSPSPAWRQFSTNSGTPLCTVASCTNGGGTAGPHSGYVWARFGGVDFSQPGTVSPEISSIYQDVVFPACLTALEFHFWIGAAAPGSDANDLFRVTIDGDTVFLANATQKSSYPNYKRVYLSVNNYIDGNQHRLEFSSQVSGQLVTFNLDDMTLYEEVCPIIGNTGVDETVLSYTDVIPQQATSMFFGHYAIFLPKGWSGTVTPSHPCFTFSPAGRAYTNLAALLTAQNYTPAFVAGSGCADIDVLVGGVRQGRFGLPAGTSTQVRLAIGRMGPVKVMSTNAVPLIGAERLLYRVNRVDTSFTEMMALPNNQVDTIYWLPWYNNVDLDTQLRFANVTGSPATVTITIGGLPMGDPIQLAAGASTRVSFPGVNNGPVKIVSTRNIVAAERLIYKVAGKNTSFTEMMALPNKSLDTTYWLPWYNNADLDTQLRFANVSGSPASVHVYIGGGEMQGSPFPLAAGESTRKSFPGINNGPVKIVSDHGVPVVVAERLIYKVGGVTTSFTEMMALPNSALDTTYWLPWYNNVDLDTQLRFANVHDTQTGTVHVYIGGVEMAGSPFTLLPGESTRKSFAGVNSGPVKIVSNVPIVAAERLIYKVNNIATSFSEMMALPASQLDTIYWLPWYNNVDLDTQLRFGVP